MTAVRDWVGRHGVLLFALLVLLYMFTPIFVVVLMSFNDPASRLGYAFDGFTLSNWTRPLRGPAALLRRWGSACRIGLLATGVGHAARHAHGLRDGAAPLPRPGQRRTC